MQFFKSTNFNFIGNRNIAFFISGALILASIISLVVKGGPNYSIDFMGGTVVQLKFEKNIQKDLAIVRSVVSELGLGQPEIKTIGAETDNEIQIIVEKQSENGTEVGDKIKGALLEKFPDNKFEVRREEKVGPKIGNELKRNAILAILLSLLVIVIYVGIRFHLPFGIAAIVALFHDVTITIGIFSITNSEISLPIIAALLTIVGYSLNDTIVVFDRIRENLEQKGGDSLKKGFDDKVNASINQSLSRTIITSLTTLVVVVTIFSAFFTSGDVLKFFAGALLTGIIVGTYSSIYIASPVLVLWNKKWPIK